MLNQNKFLKRIALVIAIIILPFLVAKVVSTPTPFEWMVVKDNEWIGFYGGYIGSIITLIVMWSTNNATKKIQIRNEVNSFCDSIATIVSNYCQKTRSYRSDYKTYLIKNEDYRDICQRRIEILQKQGDILNDNSIQNPLKNKDFEDLELKLKELTDEQNIAMQRMDSASERLETSHLALYFELKIKLQNIPKASELLEALENHDSIFLQEKDRSLFIQSETNVLELTKKFIEEYSKQVEL